MKKITIIQLLNKIANGELKNLTLVKFCKNDCLAKYHKTDERFEFINKGDWDNYFNLIDIAELNDEVEILDTDEFEDIVVLVERLCLDHDEITPIERATRNQVNENRDMITQLIKNQKKIIERLQHENSKDNV